MNEKLPTITTKEGGEGKRGKGMERDLLLPVSPAEIAARLKASLPHQRINESTILKICILIHECYAHAKSGKQGKGVFALSNSYAEIIVSRIGGRRPLALLDEMGFTRIVGRHRSTICPASTKRQFCHTEFKPYSVRLRGPVATVYQGFATRGKLRREKDVAFTWVRESLKRISLSSEDQEEYRGRENHEKTAARFGQGERRLKWNRSYRWNCVCQMPADVRARLRFDADEPATQLDISCSFGIMLPWLFSDEVKHLDKKGLIDGAEKACRLNECQRLRIFLSDGDFYSDLLPLKPREEAKKAFQRFLNDEWPDPVARAMGDSFSDKFPHNGRMVCRRGKRSPRSSLSAAQKATSEKRATANLFAELQGRQNDIMLAMVRECARQGICCIPVWDELIVPLEFRTTVLEWMHAEIFKRTGVLAKVGGVRMGAPQVVVTPCPAGLCPVCWEKRIINYLGSTFACVHQVRLAGAQPFFGTWERKGDAMDPKGEFSEEELTISHP